MPSSSKVPKVPLGLERSLVEGVEIECSPQRGAGWSCQFLGAYCFSAGEAHHPKPPRRNHATHQRLRCTPWGKLAVTGVHAKCPVRKPRSRALLEPASRTFAAALVRAPGRRAPGAAAKVEELACLDFVAHCLSVQEAQNYTGCKKHAGSL